MIYRAIQLIQIFCAHGRTDERTNGRTKVIQEVLADLKIQIKMWVCKELLFDRNIYWVWGQVCCQVSQHLNQPPERPTVSFKRLQWGLHCDLLPQEKTNMTLKFIWLFFRQRSNVVCQYFGNTWIIVSWKSSCRFNFKSVLSAKTVKISFIGQNN